MQKLRKRNTYAPTNASQVRGNCDLLLNKDQSLSATSLKTSLNNPEVNQRQQQTGGLKVNVFVLSKSGSPLMPCSATKARKLLKSGKAKVMKRFPFVIKLEFKCENQVQKITLGIDSGYRNVGFSAVSTKKELASGTLILDDKTSKRLTEKRMYRRLKRSRLQYRKRRFLNKNISKGWLPPSTKRKIDTHINFAIKLSKLIPISKIVVETAKFDIQKIENPEIQGVEYQQGNLYGYENVKAFVLEREKGKCQVCGGETNRQEWHLHHIIERNQSGTNRSSNIALFHKQCHKKFHKKGLKLKPNREFKAETFMSIAKSFVVSGLAKYFKVVEITFGYITKINRIQNGIEKTHNNDAFVVAGGTKQKRCKVLNIVQKHRNNRVLGGKQRKGFAPSSRKQRYKIQPRDLIWINGKMFVSRGCTNYGREVYLKNHKTIGIKKIEKTFHFGSFAFN